MKSKLKHIVEFTEKVKFRNYKIEEEIKSLSKSNNSRSLNGNKIFVLDPKINGTYITDIFGNYLEEVELFRFDRFNNAKFDDINNLFVNDSIFHISNGGDIILGTLSFPTEISVKFMEQTDKISLPFVFAIGCYMVRNNDIYLKSMFIRIPKIHRYYSKVTDINQITTVFNNMLKGDDNLSVSMTNVYNSGTVCLGTTNKDIVGYVDSNRIVVCPPITNFFSSRFNNDLTKFDIFKASLKAEYDAIKEFWNQSNPTLRYTIKMEILNTVISVLKLENFK